MNLESTPSSPVSTETHHPISRTGTKRTKTTPKRVVAKRIVKAAVASARPGRGKFGPKPRSNSEKALLYLTKIEEMTASSYDIAHLLGFSGNWAPVQAVSVLEQLVRGGKIKKMKAHGETRYAHL